MIRRINNKKAMTQIKTYFIIVNLVLAVVAFSWVVGGVGQPTTQPATTTSATAQGFNAAQKAEIKALMEEGVAEKEATKKVAEKSATKGFAKGLGSDLFAIAIAYGIGYMIGGIIGDNADKALGAAAALGTLAYQVFGKEAALSYFKWSAEGAFWGGVVVGAVVFIAMYKKESIKKVEFKCLPWEPPIGGQNCEDCNDYGECSEYRCKSLGQACELLNAGEKDEKCTWVNRQDVNSPLIKITDVNTGHVYLPDTSIRPPATGIEIRQVSGGPCIEAFTALEFDFVVNEPAQCKVDYNLTKGFEEMAYYVGGSNSFKYNHTESMSLPGPDTVNAIAPELKNDGIYTLYLRCRDANNNFNQDPYSVRFCVKKGPDTTPPRIDSTSVPSNSAITFNKSELALNIYLNEPSECKWSREDKDYTLMENNMSCELNLWDMKKINNKWVYTCETTLIGIENRKENNYYFRCKDKPNALEADRNENKQSFLYTIVGTQPLTLLELKPEEGEIIRGSTDSIPVILEIKTDNGYRNGESICSYSESDTIPLDEDYIDFSDTGGSEHKQRQDINTGSYNYYIRCIDLGGNAVYDKVSFEVESDNNAPIVVRVYKEAGQLRIVTVEEAGCAYSNKDCNFEIEEGIALSTVDNKAHATDWITNKNYYIRCKDNFENQPGLSESATGCSIVVRPYEVAVDTSSVVVL